MLNLVFRVEEDSVTEFGGLEVYCLGQIRMQEG